MTISRFRAFARLKERKVVDRAKGIPMRLKGLDEEKAYALLRCRVRNWSPARWSKVLAVHAGFANAEPDG